MVNIHPVLRDGVYVLLLLAIMWYIIPKIISLDYLVPFSIPSALKPAGIVLVILGAMLTLWCRGILISKGKGTPNPVDPPKMMVFSGPYRYVRNPMYIGYYTTLFGLSLWLPSSTLLLIIIVSWPVVNFLIVHLEEPQLEKRFKGSYLKYKEKVPRWVPKFSRS